MASGYNSINEMSKGSHEAKGTSPLLGPTQPANRRVPLQLVLALFPPMNEDGKLKISLIWTQPAQRGCRHGDMGTLNNIYADGCEAY